MKIDTMLNLVFKAKSLYLVVIWSIIITCPSVVAANTDCTSILYTIKHNNAVELASKENLNTAKSAVLSEPKLEINLNDSVKLANPDMSLNQKFNNITIQMETSKTHYGIGYEYRKSLLDQVQLE